MGVDLYCERCGIKDYYPGKRAVKFRTLYCASCYCYRRFCVKAVAN